jgi:LPS O-antigen subunit length determinant protein (WzzB/FepE family)
MNELVSYTAQGLENFQVRIDEDTVWLTQAQMVELFERDQSVISRHINNVFKEKELTKSSNMHFLHITNIDKPVAFYSLDVIISVGYRVKSQRGTQFRIWATSVLKEYLLKGAAIHRPASKRVLEDVEIRLQKQIEELRQALENSKIVADTQLSEIYQALIQLASKKEIAEKPRKRIGFNANNA